jgi:uncharacterized membrane protein
MAAAVEEKIATGLGWFSIGLGLAELVAPRQLSRFIGLEDGGGKQTVLRTYGLREISAGIGILAQPKPTGWLWARVAGDAMDLASLGMAFKSPDACRGRLAGATAAVVGVTALDILTAQRLSQTGTGQSASSATATESVIIGKPPQEVYAFWRDFNNLPRFISYVESVRVIDHKLSHWTVQTAAGKTLEWDAEITLDQPGSRISWRSIEGADVPNSGSVSFTPAPGNRGTVVRVQMDYAPPGGPVVAKLAKLLKGEPAGLHISQALRSLKQILETGEVTKSDASIHPGMHPAQPPESVPSAMVNGTH